MESILFNMALRKILEKVLINHTLQTHLRHEVEEYLTPQELNCLKSLVNVLLGECDLLFRYLKGEVVHENATDDSRDIFVDGGRLHQA